MLMISNCDRCCVNRFVGWGIVLLIIFYKVFWIYLFIIVALFKGGEK